MKNKNNIDYSKKISDEIQRRYNYTINIPNINTIKRKTNNITYQRAIINKLKSYIVVLYYFIIVWN